MKVQNAAIYSILVFVFIGLCEAQEQSQKEIYIHKNIRLVLLGAPLDMPEELKNRYDGFLPLFEKVLIESTSDRKPESALTIRLKPDIKEIGSAKTKRAIARITAYRKDLGNEFMASILIYSYATGGTVNKEEIGQVLKRQILNPLDIN